MELEKETVRTVVPALIFAKCRYLFYNTKGTTSLIVPRNLRDLRMLIRMLFVMEDYDKDDKTGRSLANKHQFKRYFFGSWLDDMDMRYRWVAHSLINEVEPTRFNKKVLDLLDSVCHIREKLVLSGTMADIMNAGNMAYNISVGDVFHVLRRLDNMDTSADFHKLVFFIKSLYSIKLYECYDELTEMPREVNADEEKPYRGEELENVSNYGKLVAGNLFALEGDTLLPKENGILEREIRNIQGGKLMALITKVVQDYDDAADKQALLNSPEYAVRLRVAEFFMLTVSRYIWTTENDLVESGIHKFRLQAKAFYDRHFDDATESMMFDILAPFFTLSDIRHSYERFNDGIYSIAQQCPSSVYNRLNAAVEGDGRGLLSRACLRNSEVMDDLFTWLQMRRGQYRTSDNMLIIEDFYNFFANYSICTYDKWQGTGGANDEKYYKITFPSFAVLAGLFDDGEFSVQVSGIYEPDKSAGEIAVERDYPRIWQKNKSMKGKTVISRMKESYPELYENMGEDTLHDLFEDEKTFRKNSVIKKLAQAIANEAEQGIPENRQAGGEPEADNPDAEANASQAVVE